jgi:putative oxidoreductase
MFPIKNAATLVKMSDFGLLILRLAAGGMMAFGHGLGKLTGFMKGAGANFPDPLGIGGQLSMGLAAGAEFFAALMIIIGLKTRLSTIPLIITMSVAAFLVHGSDPFAQKEKALLYLAMFIIIFLCGPGRHSVDAKLRK